jgi:hypothetical protein
LERVLESSFVGFDVLDDNTIKGSTTMLSVEQVLSEKTKRFNTWREMWWSTQDEMTMVCVHHKQSWRMDNAYVELIVHNLEMADRTEDEGKKNFEELSAQDKVKHRGT